ncbi:unnamed protein product [Scytosiphon promiscuus]
MVPDSPSASGRTRGMTDEELPPPPASPPRGTSEETEDTSSTDRPPAYEEPSAEKGEEFRQTNLPRRIPDDNQPTNFRLARPGEKLPGKEGPHADPPLYDVWRTSYKALDEFGIGVGLYYRQLLFLGIVITLCVVVYIPTMVHNAGFNGADTPIYLSGTAHNASREDLSLNSNGIPDLTVTLMLVMFALVSRKMEMNTVAAIDTAQQTPQDYSVCIHSPPRAAGGEEGTDMYDPDTYHRKFEKYGEIVFITVCLANGNLMKTVAKKRVLEHKADALKAQEKMAASKLGSAADGVNSKTTADLKGWQAWLQKKLGLFATKDYLDAALEETGDDIKNLATSQQYEPKRVYITFNTEQAQRKCLKAVETGLCEETLARFRKKQVNQNAVIGGRVCRINEAEEPSDIVWENIDTSFFQRARTWALSAFLSALFLTGTFFILAAIFESGLLAAIFIAIINAVLPLVIRALTLIVEVHKSSTQRQASMMFKLVVSRSINSAFLLFIITSDIEQLEAGTLTKILTILVADAFSGPLLRLTNIPDLIGRKLIAPKQKTQAEMNVFFQGALWNLAERYTDMIKTVVVGLFYSAIVPTGLFITAAAMIMLYWVDKYSLLRLWKRPPAYNESLSSQTRMYITLCIWMHLIMARVFFAKWPSQRNSKMPDCGLFSCNYREGRTNFFTDDQAEIVTIYEILGLLVFAVGGGLVLFVYGRHYATKLVINKHREVGKASDVAYRSVSGISAYVPLIFVRELTDPLLAINVKELPRNAHSFLPLRIGGFYNPEELSMNSERDFPFGDVSEVDRNGLFGKVRYYLGPEERLWRAPTHGGILFTTVDTGRQETAAAADVNLTTGRFGLTRQPSATGNATFMLPAGPVHASDLPQRSQKRISRWGSRGPLPSGWEERVTGTGRPYYVCHETRVSQWERPTMAIPTSSRNLQGAAPSAGNGAGGGVVADIHNALRDLPPGWEVKFADDGRPYYVDNNRRITQWQHPAPFTGHLSGEPVAEFKSEKGTTKFVEQYTAAGLRFFVNPVTKESRWSPPRERDNARRRVINGNDGAGPMVTTRGNGSGSAGAATATAAAAMDSSVGSTSGGGGVGAALPPGWEQRTNPAGRPYFLNHDLRITQWSPPDPIRGPEPRSAAPVGSSSAPGVNPSSIPTVQFSQLPTAPASNSRGGPDGDVERGYRDALRSK